jgi:hypothetical protein
VTNQLSQRLLAGTSKAVLLAAAIGAATGIYTASAPAAVIYNGGGPNQAGQIYSESPGSNAAMSFSLASSATLTGVQWWGGCYPSTTCSPSPDFAITIWSNSSAGTPGSVLDFQEILDGNQTPTGQLIGGSSGWDEYSYSASLLGFPLAAGTTYWLDIQETSGETSGAWGWESTSSAPSGAELEWQSPSCTPIDGTSWCSLPEQLAFELVGTQTPQPIPEPGSLSILGAGLAGLLIRRRRRGVGQRRAGPSLRSACLPSEAG